MKTIVMASLLILALSGCGTVTGAAPAQDRPADAPRAGSPETIEGQVTKVEAGRGRMTIRANDGTAHEFEASAETLRGYKAGDPIKAKLRKPAP